MGTITSNLPTPITVPTNGPLFINLRVCENSPRYHHTPQGREVDSLLPDTRNQEIQFDTAKSIRTISTYGFNQTVKIGVRF